MAFRVKIFNGKETLLCGNYLLYSMCFVVLAEDAIKAALADYKVKQGGKKVESSN